MLVNEPQNNSDASPLFADETEADPWTAGLEELAAARLVLTGESVVDLPRLWFSTRERVDRFLRVLQFDTDNPLDLNRLWELHHEALSYLTEQHGYRFPRAIEEPDELHQLFLDASIGPHRRRRMACTVLKTMHIMHHINGRELVFNTPISEAQLLDLLSTRIFTTIDRMRTAGVEVQEFAAGKKSRDSMVTKLLAKQENLATHIFDKVRFRVVVGTAVDLVQSLVYLLGHLVPFNYVVPGQSQNGIIRVEHLAEALDLPLELVDRYWSGRLFTPPARIEPSLAGANPNPPNEFSGRTFRCVNFVADIPIRIDEMAPQAAPAIIFVQAEIQLVDAETHAANNRGENAHELYKQRQLARVRNRLESR